MCSTATNQFLSIYYAKQLKTSLEFNEQKTLKSLPEFMNIYFNSCQNICTFSMMIKRMEIYTNKYIIAIQFATCTQCIRVSTGYQD